MNDFQMPRFRQCNPSTVKRARLDANFGSQLDISAYQSTNLTQSTPQQCRRSSISYFAEGSPSKFDMSFDSDEIFRLENVLNPKRADDVNNNNNNNNNNSSSSSSSREFRAMQMQHFRLFHFHFQTTETRPTLCIRQ